jgi:hypothetical protein
VNEESSSDRDATPVSSTVTALSPVAVAVAVKLASEMVVVAVTLALEEVALEEAAMEVELAVRDTPGRAVAWVTRRVMQPAAKIALDTRESILS